MSGVFLELSLFTLDTVVHKFCVFLLNSVLGRVIRLFHGSQPYTCISVFILSVIILLYICSYVVLWTSYV